VPLWRGRLHEDEQVPLADDRGHGMYAWNA
jgi:hypothetical protein